MKYTINNSLRCQFQQQFSFKKTWITYNTNQLIKNVFFNKTKSNKYQGQKKTRMKTYVKLAYSMRVSLSIVQKKFNEVKLFKDLE